MTGCINTEPRHIYQSNTNNAFRQSKLAIMKHKNTKITIKQLHNDGMYKYRTTSYVSRKHKKA